MDYNKMNEENEQELCIGDEIEYIKYGKASEKRIVIRIDNREGDEKIIWTIGLDRFDQYGTSTNDPTEKYRKTGTHYDSIPLNKEEGLTWTTKNLMTRCAGSDKPRKI